MKMIPALMALFVCATTALANLQTIPVTATTQKELGLDFTLSLKHLTPDQVFVQVIAPRRGKLKDLVSISLFLPGQSGTLLNVPLSHGPVLRNQYSFTIAPTTISNVRLHLHCMPGGSSEVRYEINLHDYAVIQGIAQIESDSYDYLPFLTGERVNASRTNVLQRLRTAKIATVEAARQAASFYKVQHGGLDARDGTQVVALFPLAQNVGDFGKEDDLIWDVRLLRAGSKVSDHIWINSRNGQGRAMLAKPSEVKTLNAP